VSKVVTSNIIDHRPPSQIFASPLPTIVSVTGVQNLPPWYCIQLRKHSHRDLHQEPQVATKLPKHNVASHRNGLEETIMLLTIAHRYHRHSSRGTISSTSNRIFTVITILAVFTALSGHTVAVPMGQDDGLRGVATSSDVNHVTYIVILADDCKSPAEACDALARGNGCDVEYVYDETFPGCSLDCPLASHAQEESDEMMAYLSDSPKVNYVEEDQLYSIWEGGIFDHTLDQPIPPPCNHEEGNIFDLEFKIQTSAPTWGLDRIDQCSLPLDGNFTKQNATGVTVFILDTGIRADHVEFTGMINTTDTCHMSAIITEPDALTDEHGHG
jgi:hypothetical protein